MSFYDLYRPDASASLRQAFAAVSAQDVERALARESRGSGDFLALLSPVAERFLEPMAAAAHEITLRHFGKTIRLYAPLYLSDHCDNQCAYCSFNARNRFVRRKLTLEDVDREAGFVSAAGIRHILILTGESRRESPVRYIRACVQVLKRHFQSISIEIYPLTGQEYREVIDAGVDGLTIYQETYDEAIYQVNHPAGPKSDYRFRLDAPERGARSGMRQVNIGALLGLAGWRNDAFHVGLHACYLQERYPDVEIGVSVPRLRPSVGNEQQECHVNDRNLVQMILALRLYLPRADISLSTRECPALRDNLIPLGITRMSAGSVTGVGGYTCRTDSDGQVPQFEIVDRRNVSEIVAAIRSKGYAPVFQDWRRF